MPYSARKPASFLATLGFGGTSEDTAAVLVQGGTRPVKLNTDAVLGLKTGVTSAYMCCSGPVRYAADSLVVQRNAGIYTSTNGGSTWALAHSFADPEPTAVNQVAPIVPVFDAANNVLKYCGFYYHDISNNVYVWTWEPIANTFVETDTGTIIGVGYYTSQGAIQQNDLLYYWTISGLYLIDFLNATATAYGTIASPGNATWDVADMLTRNGELWCAAIGTSGTPSGTSPIIGRWIGSEFNAAINNVADPDGVGATTAYQGYEHVAITFFYDPESDKGICLWWADGGQVSVGMGLIASVVDLDTETYEDATYTIIPPELLHYNYTGGQLAFTASRNKVHAWYDTTNGDLAIFIWVALEVNATFSQAGSVYQYMGVDTPLRFVGYLPTINGSSMPLRHSLDFQGFQTYHPDSKFIYVYNRTTSGSNQTLVFRAYGGGTVDLKFYFGINDITPTQQCTLTGTPSSGTLNGNTLEGATADGTEQTVDWQVGADSIGNEVDVKILAVEV